MSEWIDIKTPPTKDGYYLVVIAEPQPRTTYVGDKPPVFKSQEVVRYILNGSNPAERAEMQARGGKGYWASNTYRNILNHPREKFFTHWRELDYPL